MFTFVGRRNGCSAVGSKNAITISYLLKLEYDNIVSLMIPNTLNQEVFEFRRRRVKIRRFLTFEIT